MGAWGTNIYENDTALDIRDMVSESLIECRSVKSAISQVIAFIEGELDPEDEVPLAWIALADTLAEEGKLPEDIKEKALTFTENAFVREVLSEDAIDGFKEKLSRKPVAKKRRIRSRKLNLETGSVYLYDVLPEWKDDPFFAGWNIGFRVVKQPPNRNSDIPIAHFFRTRRTIDELKNDPALVCDAQLWPIAGSPSTQHYVFDCMILTPKVYKEAYDRLHYCGNCTVFPAVKYEFPEGTFGFGACRFLCLDENTEDSLLFHRDCLQAYYKLIEEE